MTPHFSLLFYFLKGSSAPVLKKMQKAKRGDDYLTRSFRKSRRASKNESLVSGCFLGDSDQGVRPGLSDRPISYLSKSVTSITLYNVINNLNLRSSVGDTILFSWSGIAMERQGCHLTRFLTSASLVRALNGTNEDHDDLKIEVRHEGNEVYMGVGSFQHALQILPHGEILVVIGRSMLGEIIAKNVDFDGDSRVSEDDEDLDCKISEAWEGGPLVFVDGKVVGMNLFLTTRRAVFLPWGTILKHLEHYWTSLEKMTGLARSKTSKVYRFGARPIGEKSNNHPEVHGDFLEQEQLDLDSMGYRKLPSSMSGAGMIFVNTFEETFGDVHGEGVWRKFSKRASNINRNVVALASFNGEKRFFACTGFFIEWNGSTIILTSASLVRNSGDENKIVENLRVGAPCCVTAVLLSKPSEVGNDSDPSGAPFWKMDQDDKTKLNRWPLPMPRWCNPDYEDEDKSDDDESVLDPTFGRMRYRYCKGKKVMLF
ncbi:hypothetical protein ACQ4PT_069416 [Festuca glaucescens]